MLVLAFVWLITADLGLFKPQVERFITETTGRDFSVGGDFSIDIGRTSSFVAEEVRFQNADWADDADMVTVGRVEIRVDFWSLFFGPVVVELIDVDDVNIQLIRPDDGDPNWVLPVGKDNSDEEDAGLDILFRQVDIDRANIVIESPDRTRPLHLDVEYLGQQHRQDDFLDFALRATLDERQIAVHGEVGTWDALLSGKDIEFDIEAILDTFEFTGHGRIDDVADLRRPSIEFSATGPDIDDLTRLLGVGEDGEGDIDLRGSLIPQKDGPLVLDINGHVGQGEIEATGTVVDLQSFDQIGLKMLASGPDLSRVLRIAGIHQVREAPFMLSIDAESRGNVLVVNKARMVFAEAQFDVTANFPNFPSIDDVVADVHIEGPSIERFRYFTGLPGTAVGAFSLGFTVVVDDDGIEVVQMNVKTALGEIIADGRLGDPETLLGTQFNIQVRSESLKRFSEAYGIKGLPDYPFEVMGAAEYIRGNIRTRGPLVATVERFRAVVDGQIALAPGIKGSDFAFEIEGPDLAGMIGAFTAATGIPAQPYDMSGRVSIGDDGYRFRKVSGSVGRSEVNIDGLLATRAGLAGTRFTFDFNGPEFQEIVDKVGDLEVRPGPYQLSGEILLDPDMVTLKDIVLDRPTGDVTLDLKFGLPAEREWMEFDVRARGQDVRSVMNGLKRFEIYEQPFSLNVRGNRRGAHWSFEKFDAGIGEATLTATGDLEFQNAKANTEFAFSLNMPSLAALGEVDDRRFNDQGLSISAHVIGGDGALEFEQLVARLGESDIGGLVRLQKGDVPDLEIKVFSDSMKFAPLLEQLEFEYESEPTFEDGKLIPDVQIPFDAMKKMNVSLDIDIRELQRDNLYLRDVEFEAELRDGALNVSKASFKAKSGALAARGRLAPDEGTVAASIELVARQFALGLSDANMDLAMTGDLDVNLRSTGSDLRALLGNANGVFFVNIRGGRVTDNKLIRALYGDLLQEIVNTVNPFRRTDPYTEFVCIVVPLRLDNGQLTSTPRSFIGTTKIRMVSAISVDLKNEKLELTFKTTPKRALSVSAGEVVNPYVQVVGTMGRPRLAVDEKGFLISGGAAVATGGLSILARGVWERMSRSKNPCKQTADGAIEELGSRFPDLTIDGMSRIE
jgi:uncharacterized protein involved in outer membrane biogenesis